MRGTLAYLGLLDSLSQTVSEPSWRSRAVRHAQSLFAPAAESIAERRADLETAPDCCGFMLVLRSVVAGLPDAEAAELISTVDRLGTALVDMLAVPSSLTQRVGRIFNLREPAPSREQRDWRTKLLAQLQDLERSTPRLSLAEWLSWLLAEVAYSREAAPSPYDPAQPGVVNISTIHSAKGLEWDVVFVPGLWGPRGIWASPATQLSVSVNSVLGRVSYADNYRQADAVARAESCRLAYVAFTRARRELHISAAVSDSEFCRVLAGASVIEK
jgi:superfamily I DNA/RNA helicase